MTFVIAKLFPVHMNVFRIPAVAVEHFSGSKSASAPVPLTSLSFPDWYLGRVSVGLAEFSVTMGCSFGSVSLKFILDRLIGWDFVRQALLLDVCWMKNQPSSTETTRVSKEVIVDSIDCVLRITGVTLSSYESHAIHLRNLRRRSRRPVHAREHEVTWALWSACISCADDPPVWSPACNARDGKVACLV